MGKSRTLVNVIAKISYRKTICFDAIKQTGFVISDTLMVLIIRPDLIVWFPRQPMSYISFFWEKIISLKYFLGVPYKLALLMFPYCFHYYDRHQGNIQMGYQDILRQYFSLPHRTGNENYIGLSLQAKLL